MDENRNPPRISVDAKGAHPDPFVAAFNCLNSERPLRDRELQQAASDLSANLVASAKRSLAAHLARNPKDPDALYLKAQIALRQHNPKEARELLRACLSFAPKFALARYALARLLIQLNEPDAALSELEVLLAAESDNPLFRNLQAKVLQAIGQADRSLAIRKTLVDDFPASPECWHAYGNALRASGAPAEQAAVAFRKALALRPTHTKSYWSIANLKAVRFSSDEIDHMEGSLARPDLPAEHRTWLHFSLGKGLEDAGDYARSFQHYARGNALARMRTEYDAERTSALVAATKAVFTSEFVTAHHGWGSADRAPIFIVGMQRSGSTLVEQILASHSAVEGTAELPCLPEMLRRITETAGSDYPGWLPVLDAAAAAEAGEDYLKRAALYRRSDRPFFTDKASANLWHVGAIHLVLPGAKIVDVRRHPAANGFSRFRQYFGKTNLRLAELGREYRDYVDLMAHFDQVLPGKVHRVIYEELVANPEREIRKLLAYLELPFEEACLHFHTTKRAVLTPTSEQVRKPISSEALEHWRNYERWLSPLLESLGPVLAAYPAVPENFR